VKRRGSGREGEAKQRGGGGGTREVEGARGEVEGARGEVEGGERRGREAPSRGGVVEGYATRGGGGGK